MYYNVRLPKRAWWLETNQTDKLEDFSSFEGSDNLSLKHISGAFYALVGGLVMCTIIFGEELVCYHWEALMSKVSSFRKHKTKIKIGA